MGKNRIKGIVVKIGGDATDLDKSLQGVNKSVASTQSRLKDVERLLKLDPQNTVLLQQKQKLLADAISDTEDKLEQLVEASNQAAESSKKYDAWKAAYDPIQAEIDTTSKKLQDLRDRQLEMAELEGVDADCYKALTEEVKETEKELRSLKKQAKEVNEEFDNPISPDQYDALQREIEATKLDLRGMETQAKDTARKLGQIDEDPVEDVAEAAREAEKALDGAGNEAATFGDILKAEAIVEGAKGILSGVKDLAAETKEYRKIQGSLEVSSEAAGYTAEETGEAYKKLFGILADEQSAATTLANLQALGLSQADLLTMIDNTIGGWAKYGDSIPIDGLAEAVNETAKAGRVTGNFADILNWGAREGETYGVAMREATEENEEWNKAVEACASAEDYFNLALQECATESERVNLIMQAMAGQGLASATIKWRENNASMVESNEISADLQEQLAQIGEKIEPIMTRLTQLVVTALEWFNSLDEGAQIALLSTVAIVAALGPVMGAFSGVTRAISGIITVLPSLEAVKGAFTGVTAAISGVIAKLPSLGTIFSSVLGFIAANPIVLLIGAIVALVALIATKGDEIQALLQRVDDFVQNIFAKDWTEVFGPVLGEALNSFFQTLKGIWDGIMQVFNGVIDFIRGVFTGDWQRAWEGVKEIFSGIFGALEAVAKQPINAIIGFINGAIGGINSLIEKVNNIPGINIPLIPGKIPLLANGGEVIRGRAIVGDAGPELLTVAADRTIVQPLTGNTVTNTTSMGSVTINVYASAGQDAEDVAYAVMDKIQHIYGTEETALT